MMIKSAAFLPSHLALGCAVVLASGCDSRLLVGMNPDATGAAGTMGSAGGTGGSTLPPPVDGGILDAWIAFDSDGGTFNRDIYVIRADGTGRRRLTTETSVDAQPSFSPDRTQLAFASDRVGGVMQIYLMDLATGVATPVTQKAEGAHDPAFTSDGTRVGYRSGVSVFTARLDGSDERQITDGQTCCMGSTFGAPVFSSDGQSTIYDDYNAIYAASAGTNRRTIVMPTTGEQSHPSLSPDGFNVVLQATCAGNDVGRSIWQVPATSTTAYSCTDGRRLSPHEADATHPSWGPDNAIVWGSTPGGTNGQNPFSGVLVIWEDGALRTVTDGSASDRNPSWSPIGTVIGTW